MSIGFQNPIGGTTAFGTSLIISPKSSGGAIKGYMAPQISKVDKDYKEFEHIRFTLKNAWNTNYRRQLRGNKLKQSITTPFRAVNNAGDLLSRENYSCGGTCQSFQSRPGLKGLRSKFGSISNSCIPSAIYSSLQLLTDIPAAACNVKYVYDSSNYTTYLKQRAVNKNYNELTYGGNQSNASQSAIRAVRRY